MTRSSRTAFAALGLLLALSFAPLAVADDQAEARVLFDQGAKLFHAAKYREAIAKFEAAYRLKPHGAIHFNVAQCRERLGEWPAALRSYQDYLRELPEARDRAAIRASIGRLEQRLAGAGVQALLVYTDPPGAELRIDGKVRGRTPFHITLPPATYRLTLTLDGFATEEQDAEVEATVSRVVELVLRPRGERPAARLAAAPALAAAPGTSALARPPSQGQAPSQPKAPPPERVAGPAAGATAAAPAGAAPGTAAAPPKPASPAAADLLLPPAPAPTPLVRAEPPRPTVEKGSRHLGTWVAAGVAVAAGAAGAWYAHDGRKAQDTLRDGTVHADAAALAKRAKDRTGTANILFGVSGAAAAAGVTLFFVEGSF
jgi:hypothetical protein